MPDIFNDARRSQRSFWLDPFGTGRFFALMNRWAASRPAYVGPATKAPPAPTVGEKSLFNQLCCNLA